jgi:hypothetical protein
MHTSSKFSSKRTFVFENLRLFALWRSRPKYPPPWAEYLGGRIFRAHFGRNIRPSCGWVFKGRGQGAVPFPHPQGSPAAAAFPPPQPELRPFSRPLLVSVGSPPPREGLHQAVFAMDAGYLSHLLSLGCDVTFCIILVIGPLFVV